VRTEAMLADAAMSASLDGVAVLDEDFEYVTVNSAYADLYDLDDGDVLIGEAWRCRAYLENEARFESEIHPRLSDEGRWRGQTEGVRTDGSRFPEEISVAALDVGGYVVVVRDVSERQTYEERLEALHVGTRRLFAADDRAAVLSAAVEVGADVLDEPITCAWVPGEDGLEPAAATPEATAFATEQGLDGIPALPEDSAEAAIFRAGEIRVVEHGTLDSPAAPGFELGTVIFLPLDEHGLVALSSRGDREVPEHDRYIADIFVRNAVAALDAVEREGRLRRREERLRTVVENAPLVLYVYDADGTLTRLEGKGLETFPLPPEQMLGETVFDLFAGNDPVMAATDRVLEGESVSFTAELMGRVFEFSSHPVVEDGEVQRVVGVAFDVTGRARYRDRVEALHASTREMLSASTPAEVSEVVVETARTVLDQPMTGVWLAAEGDTPRLDPVVATDEARDLLGELPTFSPGDSLAWRAYETGETRKYGDLSDTPGRYNADTKLQSELVVPIGEVGVLTCGATVPDAFDDTDVTLANLLAANAATAIERVRREEALERQTDRMEFFNSILRHDVLNGMTVIRARGEMLADTLDADQGRSHAETVVRWADDVTDVVRRVRTVIETLTGETDPELHDVDLSAVLVDEVDRVRSTYESVTVRVDVPDGLHVHADELLGEVLGNLVTNAVEHNDPADLTVAVSAERRDDEVRVCVADDGSGVPPEHRESIFRRGETGHAKSSGSGFGLFFVDTMVEAYGGSIRVEDSDMGGAAFVLTLPAGQQGNVGGANRSTE